MAPYQPLTAARALEELCVDVMGPYSLKAVHEVELEARRALDLIENPDRRDKLRTALGL